VVATPGVPAPCVGNPAGAGGSSIPIGSSASAVGNVSGAAAGTTYSFSIYAYIGTATTPIISTFSVTAQI
jgi:hypothetical protein